MKSQKAIFNLYNLAWKIILPFLKRSKTFKGSYDLRISADNFKKTNIWIHGASGGEAYVAVEILRRMNLKSPLKILYTATTAQGLGTMESFYKSPDFSLNIDMEITWLPFDKPVIIEKVILKTRPELMILLETEIWPGLLYMLKKHGIKTIIINARLSSKSYAWYRKTKFLWEEISPDIVLATSDKDAQRYKNIFDRKTRISVMPNIKFDAMPSSQSRQNNKTSLASFLPRDIPFSILASIREEEEEHLEYILKYLMDNFPDQIIGIFPKHIQRAGHLSEMLDRLLARSGNIRFKWKLRSEISSFVNKGTIILWDTFGELKHAYEYAVTAFVGGSLEPLGGQNFLEPVVCGTAAVTGPHLNSFKWVDNEIFKSKLVFKAENRQQAARYMVEKLRSGTDKTMLRKAAYEYIRKNQGGAAMAVKLINDNLVN